MYTEKVAQAAKEKNITDEDLDSWLEENEQ